MGLKISTTPSIVSEKEEQAINAENRRLKAEGEFMIILEDKKRISKELLNLEDKIEDSKKVIENKNSEITELSNKVLEIKSSFRVEVQNLEEFKKEKEIQKSQIESEISNKEKEKVSLLTEISDSIKKYELSKFEQTQELKTIETNKININQEINKLKIKKDEIIKEISSLEIENTKILEKIQNITEEKKILESSITSLKNIIEDQNDVISNKHRIIIQLETNIKDKGLEISNLEDEIIKNKKINDEEKSVHISLLRKQDQSEQRESFIKSQYERAGIKWEE